MLGRFYNNIRGNKIEHVADGAFGCVYKAKQDPCSDTTSPLKPGEVSKSVFKLMRKGEAEKEMNESSTIPPSADGVVIYKGRTCEPSTDFKKRIISDSKLNCTAPQYLKSDEADVRLNIYPNGGPDVFELLSKNSDSINSDFLFRLSILARDIDRMNKNGVYHLDVKTENMVYNVITKEVRLIDPGLMMDSKKMSDPWSSVIVQPSFPYDALIIKNNIPRGPDYYLQILQGTRLKNIIISDDNIENSNFLEIIGRQIKRDSFLVYNNLLTNIGKEEYDRLLVRRSEQYDDMMKSFYAHGNIEATKDIKDKVLETIDVYALGFVFIEVLCSLHYRCNDVMMRNAYMMCIRIIFATIYSSNVYDRNMDNCLKGIQMVMQLAGSSTFVLPSMASDVQDISPQPTNTGNALGGQSIRRKRRKTTKKRKYIRKRTNKLSSKV